MRCRDFECIYKDDKAKAAGFELCHRENKFDGEIIPSFFSCRYSYSKFACNVEGELSCTLCRKSFNCPHSFKNY